MATGRGNQLTKQVGEYLVAAEVCRRGLIATTFTGNVPHYDIIASDSSGGHQAIQVKAILRHAWQFDIRDFITIRLDGKRQILGRPVEPPYPHLLCVFVYLRSYGTDEFYIMTWEDLQRIVVSHYRDYLARNGGVRPRKQDSFHEAVVPAQLMEHRDRWSALERRLRRDG
jgi:hypothetical protein